MINKLYLYIFLFTYTSAISQKITIKGYAFAEKKLNYAVSVFVNDTLYKSLKNNSGFSLISLKKSRVIGTSSKKGKFKVKAGINDSIYFKSLNHITQVHAVRDLYKKKSNILLKEKECIEYEECNELIQNIKLKGKLIKVIIPEQPYYCNSINFYTKYNITFQVLESKLGFSTNDIVILNYYSHNGKPNISNEDVEFYFEQKCDENIYTGWKYY